MTGIILDHQERAIRNVRRALVESRAMLERVAGSSAFEHAGIDHVQWVRLDERARMALADADEALGKLGREDAGG